MVIYCLSCVLSDYKKFNSCGANFQCDNGLCIEKDLVCDRVDHCGDLSDESIDGKAACERVPLEEGKENFDWKIAHHR